MLWPMRWLLWSPRRTCAGRSERPGGRWYWAGAGPWSATNSSTTTPRCSAGYRRPRWPSREDRAPGQLRGAALGRPADRDAGARRGVPRRRARAGADRARSVLCGRTHVTGPGDFAARPGGSGLRRVPGPGQPAAVDRAVDVVGAGPAGGLRPHDAALDGCLGAAAGGTGGDGVPRERRGAAGARRAGTVRAGRGARRHAELPDRTALRQGGLHDGLGGGGVRAARRGQRASGTARGRPGPLLAGPALGVAARPVRRAGRGTDRPLWTAVGREEAGALDRGAGGVAGARGTGGARGRGRRAVAHPAGPAGGRAAGGVHRVRA